MTKFLAFKQNTSPMCKIWQTQLQNLAIHSLNDSKEVVSLSSKDVADASVVTTINEKLAREKLIHGSKSIGETIQKTS